MSRIAVIVALLLALPASAAAAPFGELAFRPVSGAATCLRPTGAPGELTRWVADGAEILQARPDGLVPVATVALGKVGDCPVAAADASGAGVLAAPVAGGVRIAVREPGGPWGAPLTITASYAGDVQVAISARGDTVVAWQEATTARRKTVRVVRRAAGGAFSAPQRLGTLVDEGYLAVAVTGDGGALAATSDDDALRIATAPPGAPFGAPRRLAGRDAHSDEPALAAAADGHALVAMTTDDGLVLFERAPGADFVRRPPVRQANSFDDIALAVGPEGAAVVAWQSGGPGGQVFAMVRDRAAAFGAPVLVRGEELRPDSVGLISFGAADDGPPHEGQTRLRALVGPDGRALLAWGTEGLGGRTATISSAGVSEVGRFGGTVRDPAAVTPLLLPGGTRALAWSDGNGIFSSPPYAGRLHLAVEGAAQPPAAVAPGLVVSAPRDRTLRPAQSLVLPVACSAACDLHASIEGQTSEPIVALTRAGTKLLRFRPTFRAIASPSGKPVKVLLRWSAPGSTKAARRTVRVRVRRLPAPPFPRIENLRARRGAGGKVEVRWSTDVPARDAYFFVFGARTSAARAEPSITGAALGRGRRSFHVTLRKASSARYVRVETGQLTGRRSTTAVVKVS